MTSRRPGLAAVGCAGTVSAVSLLGSGLWLATNYRPRSSGDGAMQQFGATDTSAGWIGDLHRISAVVLVLALLAAAGWALVGLIDRNQLDAVILGGIAAAAAATAIAYRTGGFLPYEGLALWAVRASPSYEGVWTIAWDDTVRFIFNGRETIPAEYQLRLVIHLIAAPAVLVAALGTVVARARRS